MTPLSAVSAGVLLDLVQRRVDIGLRVAGPQPGDLQAGVAHYQGIQRAPVGEDLHEQVEELIDLLFVIAAPSRGAERAA